MIRELSVLPTSYGRIAESENGIEPHLTTATMFITTERSDVDAIVHTNEWTKFSLTSIYHDRLSVDGIDIVSAKAWVSAGGVEQAMFDWTKLCDFYGMEGEIYRVRELVVRMAC